jgi:hypothetical protein
VPGGVASGFKHYDPNSAPPRLFHVKGKRNVRINEVKPKYINAMLIFFIFCVMIISEFASSFLCNLWAAGRFWPVSTFL